MSEWTPPSNQFEDDTPQPGSERRSRPLPLPRLEALPPAPKPERPAVTLFDRSLLETQVSAPPTIRRETVPVPLQYETEEDEDDEPAAVRIPLNLEMATDAEPSEAAASKQHMPESVLSFDLLNASEASPYVAPITPPARPVAPLTTPVSVATMPAPRFEDIMENAGMGQPFTEAVSGQQLSEYSTETNDDLADPPSALVSRPAPPRPGIFNTTSPNHAPESVDTSASPDAQVVSAPRSVSGGGMPPTPPVAPGFAAYGRPGGGPNGESYASDRVSEYSYSNPNAAPDDAYSHEDVQAAARAGVRQGVFAGGVAGWFAGRYFAKKGFRKRERQIQQDFAEQIQQRDATALQQEQTIQGLRGEDIRDAVTNRPIPVERQAPAATAPAFERPAAPVYAPQPLSEVPGSMRQPEAPAPGPMQQPERSPDQQVDQQPDPFRHQAEQEAHHTVRSSWLEIGVDQYGRPVERDYGRAYKEEISKERVGSRQYMTDPTKQPSPQHGKQPSHGASIGATLGSFAAGSMLPHDPQLPSGQAQPRQGLPDGHQYTADAQHRLTAPKKQVVSNIANPWFWLMLGIVIAAFFAAALI